jgi:HAD superfamily hydrolase (TIGR01509 family)
MIASSCVFVFRQKQDAMQEARQSPWTFRSVVFDLDGLMIDSEPIFHETACRLLARRGCTPIPSVIQSMMGMPGRPALSLLRDGHGLSATEEELIAETSQLFYELLGQRSIPLLPGVIDLLNRLETKGIPRAIATSSSLRYVRRILEPHGLLERFAFVLTAEDVTDGKPAPEIYENAAARLGHAAQDMVVLEDSPNGLRAAKAAGARCIVVPHALIRREDLTEADAIVPSLEAPLVHELLGT